MCCQQSLLLVSSRQLDFLLYTLLCDNSSFPYFPLGSCFQFVLRIVAALFLECFYSCQFLSARQVTSEFSATLSKLQDLHDTQAVTRTTNRYVVTRSTWGVESAGKWRSGNPRSSGPGQVQNLIAEERVTEWEGNLLQTNGNRNGSFADDQLNKVICFLAPKWKHEVMSCFPWLDMTVCDFMTT